MNSVPQPFIPLNHLPQETPPKIDVAFRALAYCRSITDPGSVGLMAPARPQSGGPIQLMPFRRLSELEQGVEAASLNLIRNWLNGETDLLPPGAALLLDPECEVEFPAGGPFQGPWPEDQDDREAAS